MLKRSADGNSAFSCPHGAQDGIVVWFALDALLKGLFTGSQKINLEFCICNSSNLCYRVFIPVVEIVLQAGSSLRHWPPGTNSKTVRAAFFFWALFLCHPPEAEAKHPAEIVGRAAATRNLLGRLSRDVRTRVLITRQRSPRGRNAGLDRPSRRCKQRLRQILCRCAHPASGRATADPSTRSPAANSLRMTGQLCCWNCVAEMMLRGCAGGCCIRLALQLRCPRSPEPVESS